MPHEQPTLQYTAIYFLEFLAVSVNIYSVTYKRHAARATRSPIYGEYNLFNFQPNPWLYKRPARSGPAGHLPPFSRTFSIQVTKSHLSPPVPYMLNIMSASKLVSPSRAFRLQPTFTAKSLIFVYKAWFVSTYIRICSFALYTRHPGNNETSFTIYSRTQSYRPEIRVSVPDPDPQPDSPDSDPAIQVGIPVPRARKKRSHTYVKSVHGH